MCYQHQQVYFDKFGDFLQFFEKVVATKMQGILLLKDNLSKPVLEWVEGVILID
jgi:hypothetical protein